MKKFAFTLAEVLITLSIIGIVSALTLPTVVKNYQTKAWKTSADVFEKKLTNALSFMNSQSTLAGYKSTEDFVNALSKNMKILKVCNNNELSSCFEQSITWNVLDISLGIETETSLNISDLKTASDFGQNNWNTNILGVNFGDGVTGLIAYNPACRQKPLNNQYTGIDCVAVMFDTSGFKNPNSYGKDISSINVKNLSGCFFKIDGVCFEKPFDEITPISSSECESIKNDFGIGECCPYCDSSSGDYWGGAVKQCGGVKFLPSSEQLTKIARYVYGNNLLDSGDTRNLNLNIEKYQSLGFSSNNLSFSGGWEGVWSKELPAKTNNSDWYKQGAGYRIFYNDRTIGDGSHWRILSGDIIQAVCIAK